jgi:beta-lactamase class A
VYICGWHEGFTMTLTLDALGVAKAAERLGLGSHAIIVRSLDSAFPCVTLRGKLLLNPASMIKVPLALAALTLVERAELRLDERYLVAESNITENHPSSPLQVGYRARLDELISLAISISDNVATNMLFDILDRKRASNIVQCRYRLANTAFHRKLSGALPLIKDSGWDGKHLNAHPPSDCAQVLEMIARAQVPRAAFLMDALHRQTINNLLSPGLRDGDTFWHKTGGTEEVSHDGGILRTESGRQYVIVLYTTLPANLASTYDKFTAFMTALRSYLL